MVATVIVMIKIKIATFYAYCVSGTVFITFHVFSFNPDHNCEKERYRQGH